MHRATYINRKRQIISTNTITEQFDSDLGTSDQPDKSLLKNCTVAVIDTDPKYYMKWYAVPCQQKIISTYICHPTHKYTRQPGHFQKLHLFCEPGWFQLKNKCYRVNNLPEIVNFNAAEQHCAFKNSSLLTLQEKNRLDAEKERDQVKIQVWSKHIYGTKYIQYMPHGRTIINILNRMNIKNKDELLRIFQSLAHKTDVTFRILVRFNERCAVAEYSARTISGFLRWTAEFCKKYILADMFICEKPSLVHIPILCKTGYYQCGDKTCILALYVCDSIKDCFNGDDETECQPIVLQAGSFSFHNSSIYLPCLIYHNCSFIAGSLVPPIKLHTLCDGLKSDLMILNEDDLCIRRRVEHINLQQMIVKSNWKRDISPSFTDEFYNLIAIAEKDKLDIEVVKNTTNKLTNQSVIYSDEYNIGCQNSDSVTRFSDLCKIKSHGNQCAISVRQYICRYIACPGMFRCVAYYYCLHMTSVCDGQKDCPFGEDEESCSRGSCPGLLKCHGEVRCVSPEQRCDGYVDCILSFDDEIACNNYPPTHCKTDDYLLYCSVNNTLDTVPNIDKLHSKGVILKGTQRNLSLNIFFTLSIVFVDVSNCGIAQVTFAPHSHLAHQKILFSNFSANEIYETTFLRAQLLTKLIVVDISRNYISMLTMKNVQLLHLIVIYAKDNPLIVISLSTNMVSLRYMNLEHVHYRWDMTATVISHLQYMSVTDPYICCLFPRVIRCITHARGDKQCYGLMNDTPASIVFFLLNSVAFTLSLFILLRTSHQLYLKINFKKYFNITKLNRLVATVLSTFSFALVSIFGMVEVNVLKWRQSTECNLINAIMSLSCGANLAFHTFSLLIVAIKIIFPFTHQCQWLKKTYAVCFLIWLCSFVSYSISTTVGRNQLVFDKFCSIGECHNRGMTKRLMYSFICGIDLLLIVALFIIFTLTASILNQQNKVSILHRQIYVSKIIFNLVRQIIPQVSFALCLYSIALVQIISNSIKDNYCYAVFSYILPIVTILDIILCIIM